MSTASLVLVDDQDLLNIDQRIEDAAGIDGKYFAIISVAHQLHCVDLIRKYMFREHYPDYPAFKDSESMIVEHVGTSDSSHSMTEQNVTDRHRTDHCIDFIRQNIMCNGDVGIMPFTDRGKDKPPKARFSGKRICRDFRAIQDWASAHAAIK